MEQLKRHSWLKLRVMLWISPELDRTSRLLTERNAQIDGILDQNTKLKEERDRLREEITGLRSDNRELAAHIKRLEEGRDLQQQATARLEKRLNDMEGRYEHMLANYMRVQAQAGKDIMPPTAG